MNELSIQLLVRPRCNLIAVDNTGYFSQDAFDITEHISLEFITEHRNKYPFRSTVILKDYLHKREEYNDNSTKISIPNDGWFDYYKFFIPKLEYLITGNNKKFIATIDNEAFYYRGHIYIGSNNISNEAETIDDFIKENIDTVLGSFTKISNDKYYLIWENILKGNLTKTLSCQKYFFTVCHLQGCLIDLQRKILNNPGNCLECDSSTSVRYRRDFLLSALYVLDYLINKNTHESLHEAQRILNNLATCSGTLCGENIDEKDDCGCGGVKY